MAENTKHPVSPLGTDYPESPSTKTLLRSDQRRAQANRLQAYNRMLNEMAQSPAEQQADATMVQQQIDNFSMFDVVDTGKGVLNGLNNLAVSNYDLFAHGILGAPQAQSFGWNLDQFGKQKSVIGNVASGGAQGIAAFLEGKSIFGLAKKGIKKVSKEKTVTKKMSRKVDPEIKANRAFWGQFLRGNVYGALGDFTGFHPKQGNLGTTLKEYADQERWEVTNPKWYEFATEFSKDAAALYSNVDALVADPKKWKEDEMRFTAQFTERLKQMPEGIILGGSIEAFLRIWKSRSLNKAALETFERLDGNVNLLEKLQKKLNDVEDTKRNPWGSGTYKQRRDAALKEAQDMETIVKQDLEALGNVMKEADSNNVNLKELDKIKRITEGRASTINAVDAELLEGIEAETLTDDVFLSAFGGDLKRVNLEGDLGESLTVISPDGKNIIINDRWKENQLKLSIDQGSVEKGSAIQDSSPLVQNWVNDLAFERGRGLNMSPSRASAEEAEIFQLNGIDPLKLKQALIAKAGGKEADGLKLYREFLEKRARWVVKLANEEGIDLATVSAFDGRTRHILCKANFNALTNAKNAGGLDLKRKGKDSKGRTISGLYYLKDQNALTVSADGTRHLSIDYIKKKFFKEDDLNHPEGLGKFEEAIEKVRNGEETFDQLAAKLGDMVNPETMGGDQDALAFVSALAELFPEKLRARKGATNKPRSWNDVELANSLGLKDINGQEVNAQRALRDNIPAAIKELAEYAEVPEEELLELLAKGNGNFRVTKEIKTGAGTDVSKLDTGDIRTLNERILAFRVNILMRQKAFSKSSKVLLNAYKDGTITEAMQLEFAENIQAMVADMEAMSLVASASGRNLRAFRDLKQSVLNRVIDPEELNRQTQALIKQFGGTEGLVDMAELLEGISNTNRIIPQHEFEAALRDHQIMKNAKTSDLLAAVNDVWMNAILSGLKTHAVNNTSMIIKGTTVMGERLAASFLPEKWFEGTIDPITGRPLEAAIAKRMARDSAIRQFKYTTSLGFELIKMYLRSDTDNVLRGVNEESILRQQEASDIVDRAMGSDVHTSQTFGKQGAALEAVVDARGGSTAASKGFASSDAIGASIRAFARDTKMSAATQKWLADVGSHPKMKGFRELYDGFYQNIVRQPARKLVLADQTFKRLHYSSSLDGSLYAYALNARNMNAEDAANWVVEIKPQLFLENGDPFTLKGLNELAVESATKLGFTGKEHTDYVNAYIQKRTVKEGLLPVKARESLAKDAMDDANDLVFQTDIDANKQLIHDADWEEFRRKENTSEAVPAPEGIEGGTVTASTAKTISNTATKNPWLRVFFPFNTTPIHLWRDAYTRLPGLGAWTKEHNADIVSGSVRRRAQAAGRQMAGTALVGAGAGLAFSGILTGAGPRDRRDRDMQRATGWREYSLRLGKYNIDYSRMEPYALPLKIIADIAEMQRYNEKDPKKAQELQSLFHTTTVAMSSSLLDATYMKGMMELVNFLGTMGEQDWDDFYDDENKLMEHLSSFVPNVSKSVTGSYDSRMREIRSNFDSARNRIYPWGLPVKRDPLFGNPINEDNVGGELWASLNPMGITEAESIAFIYDELTSVAGTLGPPAIGLKGFSSIPTTQEYATLDHTDEISEKSLVDRAWTFRAPGGERCRIQKGETYYDFRNKYISKRKVKFTQQMVDEIFGSYFSIQDTYDKSGNLKQRKKAPEGEFLDIPNMDEDTQKRLVALRDSLRSATANNPKWMTLQDITLLMTGTQEYQDTSPDPIEALNHKSARIDLVRTFIQRFRKEADNELLGEKINLNKNRKDNLGNLLPAVYGYNGIAAVYWPTMVIKLSHLEQLQKLSEPADARDPFGDKQDTLLDPDALRQRLEGSAGN